MLQCWLTACTHQHKEINDRLEALIQFKPSVKNSGQVGGDFLKLSYHVVSAAIAIRFINAATTTKHLNPGCRFRRPRVVWVILEEQTIIEKNHIANHQ